MMSRNPTSDTDSEPHTLRSDLSSHGIPICIPSHLSSLNSSPLQISQSPTNGFVTQEHKSQREKSDVQDFSINAKLQNKKSYYGSVPLDTPNLLDTTNQTESASKTFCETESRRKEMVVSKGESDEQAREQQHKRQTPTQNFQTTSCPSGNPFAGLPHEPPVGISFPDKSNSISTHLSNPAFSPPNLASPPTTAPSSDMPSSLTFFSFVILHVPEVQEEAMRVCRVLNKLDIGQGTTFCEGFEAAGVSPIKSLEDAVENSAYVVLLLTDGFLSKWGEFQTNAVLMNSINDKNKSDTVIPFYSKVMAPKSKIPLILGTLTALNEKSHLFEKQVRNTFKQGVIDRQQELWQQMQNVKAFDKQVEHAKSLANCFEQQQYTAADFQAALSQVYAHLSSLLPIPLQQMIPGQNTVININNASNVQIGNQNSMNIQTTDLPEECYRECNKEFQN
ncbi:TIR domain-containing adapter molecule 1-like [Dendropsophus ebraccatus]|uniref:TIR domain-containing adapter molecule 1-like n=1 Tax=Dendropsophus ebraccatus TaxID=150705 RepID=UPI003831CE00